MRIQVDEIEAFTETRGNMVLVKNCIDWEELMRRYKQFPCARD